jgi:hypothetical protein
MGRKPGGSNSQQFQDFIHIISITTPAVSVSALKMKSYCPIAHNIINYTILHLHCTGI